MGKKRKSLASSLDEVDRTMYSTFCSAANSLSQLYTQAMNQQKLSFLSGERHGMYGHRQTPPSPKVCSLLPLHFLRVQVSFDFDFLLSIGSFKRWFAKEAGRSTSGLCLSRFSSSSRIFVLA
ncbi:hypothetical protein RDI58_004502 [Solanum bulbocastanum]|uniref:Uncharacterized protein n=1 Tax=Solanum bulbocastanum TaxID=147425 RepID=A0AAN8U4N6_SOLBU